LSTSGINLNLNYNQNTYDNTKKRSDKTSVREKSRAGRPKKHLTGEVFKIIDGEGTGMKVASTLLQNNFHVWIHEI